MRNDAGVENGLVATDGDSVDLLRRLKAGGSRISLSINGRNGVDVRDEESYQLAGNVVGSRLAPGEVDVRDEESYQLAVRLFDRLEMIAGIKEGVRDFEEGNQPFSWEEIHREIQRKHGTPRMLRGC